MRSIKTLAASLLLAVMVSMSAQTALAGIIITGSRADNVQPPVETKEALDTTGIYISTLVNIGIIITGN